MKTETDSHACNESLDALDILLQKVIQPIIGKEFSEKINENEGFQNGKDALKKVRQIESALNEIKDKICDLPDEDVLETKFCEHSVPNGLAECADDIHWEPEQDKEKENDNAFSVPIIKIRDNLLRKMSQEIIESAKKDFKNTESFLKEQQEELNEKFNEQRNVIMEQQKELNARFDDQKNIVENIQKGLLTELENRTQKHFQQIHQQVKRQMCLIWCTLCLSFIGMTGSILLFIFDLLRK